MSEFSVGKHYLLDLKTGVYLLGRVVDATHETLKVEELCRMGPADSHFIRNNTGAADMTGGGEEEEIQFAAISRHWEFEDSPYDDVFSLSREGLFALLEQADKGVSL